MKRQPKQARSKRIVDAVLDGATRILSRARLQETTTNKIAETAGVGIGSLYDYFPNKESIVASLMDRHIDNVQAEFIELLAADPQMTVEEKMRAIRDFVIKKFFRHKDFLREIFFMAPATGRMQILYETRVLASVEIAKYLRNGPALMPEAEADKKAFLLIHGGIGLVDSYIMIGPKNFSDEEFADELLKLMLGILEPKIRI